MVLKNDINLQKRKAEILYIRHALLLYIRDVTEKIEHVLAKHDVKPIF